MQVIKMIKRYFKTISDMEKFNNRINYDEYDDKEETNASINGYVGFDKTKSGRIVAYYRFN